MIADQSDALQQTQRVQVEIETQGSGKCVKIRVESHDACLGWYTSASLGLPLHQLPLLEQAVCQLTRRQVPAEVPAWEKIIPFPALRSTAAGVDCP
jgi:hypothetical protein